jgi:hypothetical protein
MWRDDSIRHVPHLAKRPVALRDPQIVRRLDPDKSNVGLSLIH